MRSQRFATIFLLVAALPGLCQTEAKSRTAAPDLQTEAGAQERTIDESSSGQEPVSAVSNSGPEEMQVPAAVSTGGYSTEFASETPRTNYIGGGLNLMTAYDDNIHAASTGRSVSDLSYSVMPSFSWRQSSSRVLWNLDYAPGFLAYSHHSQFNQFTQNLDLASQFLLSPHVKLMLNDTFAKTSNPFNQFTPGASTSTNLSPPVTTVVSPVADQITNSGSAQLTYQFGPNSMVGATALFSDLHYLTPSQVPGLSNSHSKGAQSFYSHRLSGRHYLGAQYQFQSLLATPANARTETQGVNLFYTIYLQPTTSLSLYAGPQYSSSHGGTLPSLKDWSPSYGGSFAWQRSRMSLAMMAGHSISAGGGLGGAVRADTAGGSARGQLTKAWSAGLSAYYADYVVLTPQPDGLNSGHSIVGSVSLHRQIRDSLGLELNYTRVHQTYSNLAHSPAIPNNNRVSVSFSYQFSRPIGR